MDRGVGRGENRPHRAEARGSVMAWLRIIRRMRAARRSCRRGARMNKVVARFADGRILKGMTGDFTPGKEMFHIIAPDAPAGSKPAVVQTKDLKALFFVKDLAGNPKREERKEFDPSQPLAGRKIRILFKDGEVMLGTTHGYQPGRPGFFMVPADPESNTERCYVVSGSTKEIAFI